MNQTVEFLQEAPWTEFKFDKMNGKAKVMVNSRYIVHVYPPVQQTEGWPPIIHISIRHITNLAITDFRDFQRIKTELVHPDAEAMQMYPAESRLVDTCNQYHLWVFAPYSEDMDWPTIPVGYFYGRDVADDAPDGCNQRPDGDE